MEEKLSLTQEWDKTFPKSDMADHRKVTFHNRYSITQAAKSVAISAKSLETVQPSQNAAPVSLSAEGETAMDQITLLFNGHSYTATLVDNPSAKAFAELLRVGMHCSRPTTKAGKRRVDMLPGRKSPSKPTSTAPP